MHKEGDEIHIDDQDAKAGETSGHMRWVLGIGLLLAIVAMTFVWIIPALSGGESRQSTTVNDDISR